MEISFYTNSLGWDQATSTWTNPTDPDEYIVMECLGGSIGSDEPGVPGGDDESIDGPEDTDADPMASLQALK